MPTTSDLIRLVLSALTIGSALGSFHFNRQAKLAVSGSYERYKASTLNVLFLVACLLIATIRGVLASLHGDYVECAWQAFSFAIWLWLLKAALDDDNWLSGQGKRLKRWFKKARSIRIHFRLPAPQTSPT